MTAATEVSLWHIDLAAIDLSKAVSLLNEDERERYHRLLIKDKAAEFACTRASLKVILGQISDRDAATIALRISDDGKPFDPDCPDTAFNVSHSHGRALIAVNTASLALGVDIEVFRDADYTGLARRYFASEEIACIDNTDEECRQAVFFRIWTRKEACVKACGTGIKLGLQTFAVNADEPAAIIRSSEHINADGNWHISDHSDQQFAAAVAACGPVTIRTQDSSSLWLHH